MIDEVLAEYRRGRKGSISTNSYVELIKWHYRLYKMVEKENTLMSIANTVRNLVFGLYKKTEIYKTRKVSKN